ncbi:hypothetical protein B5E92_13535 [Erysipelatoclostridium sp. An15]|uniref:hypothetical protein n=1 Tax=Erysipelatoclostridium sp. An15 TaxID=1965566 RepID=UPI000B36E6D3|nr:hypothetical protein [Erysipelatoclostridium sp. An15]OUQ04018.1 hypothetical protein B5E92_13535 [Erysipelatoclostridium sp. An15]
MSKHIYNISVLQEAIEKQNTYFILNEITEIVNDLIKHSNDTYLKNDFKHFLDEIKIYNNSDSYEVIESNVLTTFSWLINEYNNPYIEEIYFFNMHELLNDIICKYPKNDPIFYKKDNYKYESNQDILIHAYLTYNNKYVKKDLATNLNTPDFILKHLFINCIDHKFKDNNEIIKLIIDNKNVPSAIINNILNGSNTILKLELLLNENIDINILHKLDNDDNTLVRLWSNEKYNDDITVNYYDKNNIYDYIIDTILDECYTDSSSGNMCINTDKLIHKYYITKEDVDNIYNLLLLDDNILDIVYDDDEFDIIVGWGKCINYEPLNDEEENYINHKNDYEEIFKNRFIPTIWHLKNETILKIHDKLLNKTIVNYNCFNEKHADFLYRNYVQEQECNYIDKMLTEEELQKEMFNEL